MWREKSIVSFMKNVQESDVRKPEKSEEVEEMSVFRDTWDGYNGKAWRVYIRYTDWQGKTKQHNKRGFRSKKEALEYEREFVAKKSRDINMGFGTFVEVYLEDVKPQIRITTYETKFHIVKTHILPYFSEKNLSEIDATDILQWQNEMLQKRDENGRGYSDTYLRTVNTQLSAIFNHAVRYYGLQENPCNRGKKIGKSHAGEMLFWTKDEYLRFVEEMKTKPLSYYAFEILYWTGVRVSELLALTPADFDLTKQKLVINKQLQVVRGEKKIMPPKTEKGNRIIDLPDFLCEEVEDLLGMLYKPDKDTRIFNITKSYLHHEMDRGTKASGVKRIRIHDLRHSACAALIELGFSPVQIAERLGHESETITMRYAHLYPSVQKNMADKLSEMRKGSENHGR